MVKGIKSVLYVRLPVWKIYPGGVIYVADFIHKERPDIKQTILDLALVEKSQRLATLKQYLLEHKPDAVAFSWRNMQTFGPHPENDALDVVMKYDHSPKLQHRFKAALNAISIIYDYSTTRLSNFGFMKTVRKLLPDTRIIVGGTAVSIFGDYIIDKCPADTVVVIGEGEEAMLSIVDDFAHKEGHFYYKDHQGEVEHFHSKQEFDLQRLTAVNFSYISQIFPAFKEYKDSYIGINTKRGCPLSCQFCLYNKIEGSRQRYRDPVEVAKEVESLSKEYGVKHIWFTDAQFCATKRSIKYVDRMLDEMIARDVKVEWTAYIRLNYFTPEIVQKMFATGLNSFDLSFTGSQEVIDSLKLGYKLEQQMKAFRVIKESGYKQQKIKLYIPLNAPDETLDTLQQTVERINELYDIFGRNNVLPFIFFVGIQPNTPVEKRLKEEGYLSKTYNPLTLNPFVIKRLLYNPQPLGRLIGRAYLKAAETLDETSDYIGRATIDNIEVSLKQLQEESSAGMVLLPECD